jgi:LPXTG-site transpeptidase (sortase) family protein
MASLFCFIYPLAANVWDSFRQSGVIDQARSDWENLSVVEQNADLKLAEKYNEQVFEWQESHAVNGDVTSAYGVRGTIVRTPESSIENAEGINQPANGTVAIDSGVTESTVENLPEVDEAVAAGESSEVATTDDSAEVVEAEEQDDYYDAAEYNEASEYAEYDEYLEYDESGEAAVAGESWDSGEATVEGESWDSGEAGDLAATDESGDPQAEVATDESAEPVEEEISDSKEPLGADPSGNPIPQDPTEANNNENDTIKYEEVFSRFKVFASLEIGKIGIGGMPVYHGTSDEVLRLGAGHLPNTSYPVGGANTHAVITAHSGLIGRELFTNLDGLVVGDYFSIDVLGRHLNYRVIEKTRIEPTNTDYLAIRPGRDLVSLLTCVPVGINTQRLLVTGERVIEAVPVQTQDYTLIALLGIGLLLLALLLLILLLMPSSCLIRIETETLTAQDPSDSSELLPPMGSLTQSEPAEDSELRMPHQITYITGKLRIALRLDDRLVISKKPVRKKQKQEIVTGQSGLDNPIEKWSEEGTIAKESAEDTRSRRKHHGKVLGIEVRDGSDEEGNPIWKPVEHAKRNTEIRFHVSGIERREWKDNTRVSVRRPWTITTLLTLPASFCLPFLIALGYEQAATLAHAASLAPGLAAQSSEAATTGFELGSIFPIAFLCGCLSFLIAAICLHLIRSPKSKRYMQLLKARAKNRKSDNQNDKVPVDNDGLLLQDSRTQDISPTVAEKKTPEHHGIAALFDAWFFGIDFKQITK